MVKVAEYCQAACLPSQLADVDPDSPVWNTHSPLMLFLAPKLIPLYEVPSARSSTISSAAAPRGAEVAGSVGPEIREGILCIAAGREAVEKAAAWSFRPAADRALILIKLAARRLALVMNFRSSLPRLALCQLRCGAAQSDAV